MALAVNDKSPAVTVMAEHWPVIDALLGGTAAMRKAGERYLPKQPREDNEDYQYRLKTATLFPAFARTVGVMAGKPFSKELSLSEETPERIVQLSEDIDGEGRSLHSFAADAMHEVVAKGFCGILIDYPVTNGEIRTIAQEKATGVRPYWSLVKGERILGWKVGKVRGVVALTQLRISETAEIEDGLYGVSLVNRVRVYEPGKWALWEESSRGWTLIEGGTSTLGIIPFVPLYGSREGFMHGLPPLLDLAHQNVKHWQHQSDQDDSIRFARKRLLVLIGLDDDGAEVTAGANHALRLPLNGDAKVVQGSAESVTAGRSELEALEAQMIQTGAELLVARPGERTATEAANDAEANKSELQRMVESFEDALDQALQITADWLKIPEGGGNATLYKDFAVSSLSEATAQLLLQMQQGGVISKATLIREQQRRGIIAPDIVPEDEIEAAEADGPALGSMGMGDIPGAE